MKNTLKKKIIKETIRSTLRLLETNHEELARTCHVSFVEDMDETVAVMRVDSLPDTSFVFSLHGMHIMDDQKQIPKVLPLRYSCLEFILKQSEWKPREEDREEIWYACVGNIAVDLVPYRFGMPVALCCSNIAKWLKGCLDECEEEVLHHSPSVILAMRHWSEPEGIVDKCLEILSEDHYVMDEDWDQMVSSSDIYDKMAESDLCLFFAKERTLHMQEFRKIINWHPGRKKILVLEECVWQDEVVDLLEERHEIFCLYMYDNLHALLKRMDEVMDTDACEEARDESLWLGDRLFAGCPSLHDLQAGKGISYYGRSCLEMCEKIESFAFQDGTKYVPKRFFWKSGIQRVHLPEGMKSIGSFAFEGCQDLQEVIFPDSLAQIQEGAFSGCTSLKAIRIPLGCKIEEAAFAGCVSLESIEFYGRDETEDFDTISARAFQGCISLQEVHMPDEVVYLGDYAFAGCTGLTAYKGEFLMLGSHAFDSCVNLTSVDAKIEVLGEHAFENCSRLKDIRLADYLEEIPAYAFYGCCSLQKIDFPKRCEIIREYAFAGCCALENFSRGYVEGIGNHAFEGCTSLTKFDVTGMDFVGEYAFAGCTSLEHVYWEEYVSIGSYAFKGCKSLRLTIVALESLVSFSKIPRNAFDGCEKIQDVIQQFYDM